MKKYLVITNDEKYYLIEAISSMSAAKKLTSYLLIKKNNVTLDEVFELIKNVENIIDLTKFNLED